MGIKDVSVVKAELFHVEPVAKNMRHEDMQEIWAMGYYLPDEALRKGILASSKAWTVLYKDDPVMILGVAPGTILDRVGTPWMLATPKVEEFQITFMRRCKDYVIDIAEGFDLLVNYVDSRNKKSIRWLRWLGFEILPAQPIGVLGIPFHRFEMRVDKCAYRSLQQG